MNLDDFPHLSNFLGAYFHQDWKLDDASEGEVVERYNRCEPVEHRLAVAEDIERLLHRGFSERELATFTLSAGAEYNPTLHQTSTREWLESIKNRIRRSADGDG